MPLISPTHVVYFPTHLLPVPHSTRLPTSTSVLPSVLSVISRKGQLVGWSRRDTANHHNAIVHANGTQQLPACTVSVVSTIITGKPTSSATNIDDELQKWLTYISNDSTESLLHRVWQGCGGAPSVIGGWFPINTAPPQSTTSPSLALTLRATATGQHVVGGCETAADQALPQIVLYDSQSPYAYFHHSAYNTSRSHRSANALPYPQLCQQLNSSFRLHTALYHALKLQTNPEALIRKSESNISDLVNGNGTTHTKHSTHPTPTININPTKLLVYSATANAAIQQQLAPQPNIYRQLSTTVSVLRGIALTWLYWLTLPLQLFGQVLLVALSQHVQSTPIYKYSNTTLHTYKRLLLVKSIPRLHAATNASYSTPQDLQSATNRYYNALLLLAIDLLLGWLLSSYLQSYYSQVFTTIHSLSNVTHVDTLEQSISWLMQASPAGFKLNVPLSHAIGTMLLGALQQWKYIGQLVVPHWTTTIRIAGYVAMLGVTTLLTACIDALSLLTLHISVTHHSLRLTYRATINTLKSLWLLLRGKKYNVLRKKVDICVYDMDQLMVATLLFTVLAFLFSTLTVYYWWLSAMLVGIRCVQAVMHMVVAFIDGVQLYTLVDRLLHPSRYCHAVSYHVQPIALVLGNNSQAQHATLRLKTHAQPVTAIIATWLTAPIKVLRHFAPMHKVVVGSPLPGAIYNANELMPTYHQPARRKKQL